MVDVFPSDKCSPQQALLQADEDVDKMEHVAIVYLRKGEIHPRLTCSTMLPTDMNFLGTALSHYSMIYMKD